MPGLRERKKHETRQMIAGVATELFVRRGFAEVTVAEVAEAAGVSKMTVFNYFPRKEDLFLDRGEELLDDLLTTVRERPAGSSPAEALRRRQHELLAEVHPLSGTVEGVPGFWGVLTSSPALVDRFHEQQRERADALAALLAAETGDALRSRLVADLLTTTISSVFHVAITRLVAGDDAEAVRRDQVTVIDQAFDLVEHGVDQAAAAAS
jgi:AcrR family transcriptional regulator